MGGPEVLWVRTGNCGNEQNSGREQRIVRKHGESWEIKGIVGENRELWEISRLVGENKELWERRGLWERTENCGKAWRFMGDEGNCGR